MTIFFIILSIFLLILLFFLFVKLNFKFCAQYGFDEKKYVKLRFYVIHPFFGINIKFDKKEKQINKSNENQQKEIKQEDNQSFLDKAKDLKKNFDILKNTFSNSKPSIKKTINIKEINLKMDFGLSDAAITGISTGILWATLYSAFAIVTQLFTVDKHDFKINPIFNKNIFTLECNGIIYARLVNIIRTVITILKNYNDAKKIF